jgi:hypothetical protein
MKAELIGWIWKAVVARRRNAPRTAGDGIPKRYLLLPDGTEPLMMDEVRKKYFDTQVTIGGAKDPPPGKRCRGGLGWRER